jgi:hypothetical protein
MAPGSGKKMMVPIIPEVIFLEYRQRASYSSQVKSPKNHMRCDLVIPREEGVTKRRESQWASLGWC